MAKENKDNFDETEVKAESTFKTVTFGVSFKEYLNNYRIERAAEILLRTDDKIYLVAEEVGYRDLDYFINRFIQSKGCTPTTYRKKTRSVNE